MQLWQKRSRARLRYRSRVFEIEDGGLPGKLKQSLKIGFRIHRQRPQGF